MKINRFILCSFFFLIVSLSFLSHYLSLSIGGTVPIVYSYFSEFLQMDKRGEHLSWLCMFWMIGGIYASFTAWGIIPRYGKKLDIQKVNTVENTKQHRVEAGCLQLLI